MNMTLACKICSRDSQWVFDAKILSRHSAKYYCCSFCGFLQTEDPFWIEEAYKNPINLTDTGIMERNIRLTSAATALIGCFFNSHDSYVDYAGGYGIFTRLMRDSGFDFYWHDPHTPNLLAKGFEYRLGEQPIKLVTTFESFEHFIHPIGEIEKILEISKNIFFSTEILPDPVPIPGKWWYYGLEHGQHISFYSLKSLKMISERYGLNFYSNGANLHLFSEKQINPILFKLVLKMSHRGLSSLIRRRRQGLTFSDMETLISKKSHIDLHN